MMGDGSDDGSDNTRALAGELLVDAFDCDARALADVAAVRAACDEIVGAVGVVVLGTPQVHAFDGGGGGVTALYLLSESHLAVHTWPERRACLVSLCCCRPIPDGDDVVGAALKRHVGARDVRVQRLARGVR